MGVQAMKVVILAGGQGTRLREETEFRPKPMVEVGGRPILWHIMKIYGHHGYRSFVVCLGYRGSMIKEYFLNYHAMNNDFTMTLGMDPAVEIHGHHEEEDFRVTLVETGAATNTGGRLKRIQRYVGEETFMATYGDGVADVDIPALLAFHRSHGKAATVTAVRPASRFGALEMGPQGEVEQFREKAVTDGFISGGFFVFEPRVFDWMDETSVLEREPLEAMAAHGELRAFRHEGFWQPMDTYREYTYLNDLWDRGEAPWRLWP